MQATLSEINSTVNTDNEQITLLKHEVKNLNYRVTVEKEKNNRGTSG